MPKPRTNPRKRDSAASRQRLIEAAAAVFSRLGFKAATTRLVAKKAGLNAALIARYFGNKRALLMAVVDDHSKKIVRLPKPASLNQSLLDDLLAFSLNLLHHMARQRRFLTILLSQAMVDPSFRARIKNGVLPKRRTELAMRFNNAANAGQLPLSADAAALANGILTYLEGQTVVNLLIIGKSEAMVRREIVAFFRELKKLAGA